MSYAILRAKKLKTMGAIAGSGMHTWREQETHNADKKREGKNRSYNARSSAELLANYRAAMPAKVRKNAVLAIEYLVTASPERFKEPDFDSEQYFEDALRWLMERHGKENVMASAVHEDETTPHLVVYVIPKDRYGKLNCREFLGGTPKLSAMQTDFAKKVGEKHGLRRGIKGSKAKHKTIKQFYAELNNAALQATEKPPVADRFLDLFGFKTERVKLHDQAAQLTAASALEERLDKEREKAVMDTAEAEIERIKEETQTKEEELEKKKKELKEEEKNLKKLTAELEDVANNAHADKAELESAKQQLEAAETLSKRLSEELDKTKAELYEERLRNSDSNDKGLFKP